MSRHDGVSCDACIKGNFKGRRYKCLICFDYDLCSTCYENGATTNQHTTNHPMQCILTRHDFDIFHGGEALTADQPQSLTCPFCGKMGFTESTLQEHVTANHADAAFEVVCPICASVPGGDPNHLTDDFAAHLTLDHRTGAPRELDVTETGGRHGVRRMPHQGRTLSRGVARQNMRSVSSGFFSSSSRDSMDPIAELLSQLSGVRRATASDLLSTADSHLGIEQAATRQQQLERLPTRRSGTGSSGIAGGSGNNAIGSAQTISSTLQNGNAAGTGIVSNASGLATTQSGVVASLGSNTTANNVTASHHSTPAVSTQLSNRLQGQQAQFLLSRLGDIESEQEITPEVGDRASFMQELLLSTLSELSLGTCRSSTEANNTAVSPPADKTGPPSSNLNLPPFTPCTCDASTQTNLSSSPPGNILNSPLPQMLNTAPPLTKSTSTTSVTLSTTQVKASKAMTKTPVVTRSSPTMQPLAQQQSNGSNLGSGRVVTGTGTVSVPPPIGAPGRGRATGGSVSPGAGRRKPVRGVEGRTTQPPPPH